MDFYWLSLTKVFESVPNLVATAKIEIIISVFDLHQENRTRGWLVELCHKRV